MLGVTLILPQAAGPNDLDSANGLDHGITDA